MGKGENNLDNTSDDEFLVEPDTAIEEGKILQRLKEFSFYLVENIELNLNLFLKLLEERDVPAKQNSLYVTGLSLALKAIPKIGAGASGGLISGEKWILNKIDKKSSRILADMVYYYSDNKETLRKILIESAVNIFYCFEDQFRKLTCKGGEKRAMQKLANDAADRIFFHFLKTEQKRDVTRDEVTKENNTMLKIDLIVYQNNILISIMNVLLSLRSNIVNSTVKSRSRLLPYQYI